MTAFKACVLGLFAVMACGPAAADGVRLGALELRLGEPAAGRSIDIPWRTLTAGEGVGASGLSVDVPYRLTEKLQVDLRLSTQSTAASDKYGIVSEPPQLISARASQWVQSGQSFSGIVGRYSLSTGPSHKSYFGVGATLASNVARPMVVSASGADLQWGGVLQAGMEYEFLAGLGMFVDYRIVMTRATRLATWNDGGELQTGLKFKF